MIKSKLAIILFIVFTLGCSEQTPPAGATEIGIQNFRDVSVAQAAQMINDNKELIVLDIRTPEEYSEGHIEGALNIDFRDSDFEAKLAGLDKSKTYILHCHSGGRSGKANKTLEKMGFTDIAHLNRGIQGWRDSGQPQITQ